MTRRLTLVATLGTVLALASAGAAAAKTYFAAVGPGFNISFENRRGNDVNRIKAGTHTVKVDDNSSFHNFRLKGQGINKRTTVAFVGGKTWTLTFPEGRYRFRCDPHRTTMRGSFRAVA